MLGSRLRKHAQGLRKHAQRLRKHAQGLRKHAQRLQKHAQRMRKHAQKGLRKHDKRPRKHAQGLRKHAWGLRKHPRRHRARRISTSVLPLVRGFDFLVSSRSTLSNAWYTGSSRLLKIPTAFIRLCFAWSCSSPVVCLSLCTVSLSRALRALQRLKICAQFFELRCLAQILFYGVRLRTLVPLCGARVLTAPAISRAAGKKIPPVLSTPSCCQAC